MVIFMLYACVRINVGFNLDAVYDMLLSNLYK